MTATIKTKKYGLVTFFCSDFGKYVFADLNGKSGTLGEQICAGGHLTGSTLSFYGDENSFSVYCRKWWKKFLKNERV